LKSEIEAWRLCARTTNATTPRNRADEDRRYREARGRDSVHPHTGMTAKNRNLLRLFAYADAVQAFLGLPERIRREAERDKRNPKRKAMLAQRAAATAVVQVTPIRSSN
jgi:hypothetical protein